MTEPTSDQKTETCFIGMPIGEQRSHDGELVSSERLTKIYKSVIKKAVAAARSNLIIERVDRSSRPGDITDQIYEYLLTSEWAVFDITWPNANVFYELGIRQSTGKPTILIKQKNTPDLFDTRQQRYIKYSTDATDLDLFIKDLKGQFSYWKENPVSSSFPVLDIAQRLGYSFPDFSARRADDYANWIEELITAFTSMDKEHMEDINVDADAVRVFGPLVKTFASGAIRYGVIKPEQVDSLLNQLWSGLEKQMRDSFEGRSKNSAGDQNKGQ